MTTEPKKERALTLVVKTYSSNPDYNGDCDYAVVEVTQSVVDTWLKRMSLVSGLQGFDDMLLSLDWADWTAGYFEWSEEVEELAEERLDTGSDIGRDSEEMFVVEPAMAEAVFPEDAMQSTESGRFRATDSYVRVDAVVKHADVQVSSCLLFEKELLDLRAWFVAQEARKEDARKKKAA
jgi:hypothetical protein